jgi:hypothetical protein
MFLRPDTRQRSADIALDAENARVSSNLTISRKKSTKCVSKLYMCNCYKLHIITARYLGAAGESATSNTDPFVSFAPTYPTWPLSLAQIVDTQ